MKVFKNGVQHIFDQEILKKYDIRGTFTKNLTEADAYYLGRSFAVFLHRRNLPLKVCVGYDGRVSSPILEKELVDGLLDSGVEVMRIGLVPTPMLYFATKLFPGYQAGIMITGSHNPPDQNGFKMLTSHAPIFDLEILELAEIAKIGQFMETPATSQNANLMEKYLDKITALNTIKHQDTKTLSVVWDPANGAACEVIKKLIERLPGVHKILNDTIDGTFPSHHADPTQPKNLEQLINVVREQQADLGIAFDGDGDRIGVVDGLGRILFGDQLLMIFAHDLLQRVQGAKIIVDIKTGDIVLDDIRKHGGDVILWKTGHSWIKQKMQQEGALLAGEMSGHIFFAEDYYGYDDAIFAACRLLRIIMNKNSPSLMQIYDQLPKSQSTPEVRIECPEKIKFKIIEKLHTHLQKLGVSINNIDGVRVTHRLGWWLIRASNTQSCLVIRADSDSARGLKQLCEEIKQNLHLMEETLDLSPLQQIIDDGIAS